MYEYNAKIIRVIDGDSVVAEIDVGFNIKITHHLRILGINTPEMTDKDPVIRARAVAAKTYLTNLILNKDVVIRTTKADSFGRYLADISLNGLDVGKDMINLGHAVEYKK